MAFILPIIIFGAGTIFGSFLNVLIDRLPASESVFKPRSRCESCRKSISPKDLVPIISFLSLSGRCRYCHAKIPVRLPLVEVVSGIIASALFLYALNTNLSPVLSVILFIIMLCFLGIFFTDLTYGIIPDEFIIAITCSIILLLVLSAPNLIPQHFFVGLVSLLLFLSLYAATRGRGFGFGDVKLMGAIGFFLGFPSIIVGTYVAFLTALLVSMILILMGLKKLKGSTIAFGPFLSVGAVVGYFFGSQILALFFK